MPLTVMDRSALTRASTMSSERGSDTTGYELASTVISGALYSTPMVWTGWLGVAMMLVGCDNVLALQPLPEDTPVAASSLALGFAHTCTIRHDGTLVCWG